MLDILFENGYKIIFGNSSHSYRAFVMNSLGRTCMARDEDGCREWLVKMGVKPLSSSQINQPEYQI